MLVDSSTIFLFSPHELKEKKIIAQTTAQL